MMFHNIPKVPSWVVALFIGSVVTVLFSTPGWADSREYGHCKRHDAGDFIRHALMAKEDLGITAQQETRLRAIKIAFKKERITRQAEVDLAKVDLHALLHNDQSAMAQIEAAVKTVYGLKADLRVASIKARREAKAVLTPEQQEKMRTMHGYKKHEMGREHHRGRGHK